MPTGNKDNHPNGYRRCTKEELEARINLSADYWYSNPDSSYTEFVNWCKEMFNVERDCANRYRKEAFVKIAEYTDDKLEGVRRIAIASMKKMYNKAVEAGDDTLALKWRMEINKITGLYTTKVEVNDVTEKPIFDDAPIKASETDGPEKE